ncbi:hypothetical protein ACFQZI_20315 [Mucilaginibacter lutimaris]|uniref:Uncharacterized protein n=1 Tax=Mucilaginibacter lutimaris TaxID=931629 RepID=A0ABW2ZM60_9SPHI
MKYIKVIAAAIVAMFAFEGAKAQVVVAARIGAPAPRTVVVERPVERRLVVVNRHHRRHYRRPVVVERPVYYHRPVHRRVIVRHY